MQGAALHPQIGLELMAAQQDQWVAQGVTLRQEVRSLGASAQWEIDLWGRLRDQRASSLAQLEAAGYQFEDLALSLSASTSKAWFSAIEARL
jgi:outer membrane protein, multidrug efflux system